MRRRRRSSLLRCAHRTCFEGEKRTLLTSRDCRSRGSLTGPLRRREALQCRTARQFIILIGWRENLTSLCQLRCTRCNDRVQRSSPTVIGRFRDADATRCLAGRSYRRSGAALSMILFSAPCIIEGKEQLKEVNTQWKIH